MATSMKDKLLSNIEIINENVHLDYKNTKKKFDNKVNIDSEIFLIISADFENPITKTSKILKQIRIINIKSFNLLN